MQEWYLGWENVEASSVQVCPHREVFHCIPELGVSGAALGHTGLFYGGARPQ